MERRQRPPVTGTWDRPHYGDHPAQGPPRFPQYPPSRSGPQHGEPHPRDYYPDGGAQRPGPWELRPPYDAGPPDRAAQDGPEQRAPSTDSRGGVTLPGPLQPGGLLQPGLPPPDVFPLGGPRPGIPHPQDMGPEPRIPPGTLHRAADHYGNGGTMLTPGQQPAAGPPQYNAPHHGTAQPPHYNALFHGTAQPPQYNAPHHGTAQPPQVGRPQQCSPAAPQEAKSRDNISLSGGLHYVSHELPRYSEGSPPRSERPDFYPGAPGPFRGPDPVLSQYSHGGRQPAGLQHDGPHRGSNLQSEGPQPAMSCGASQPGLYRPITPPVPDAFNYRASPHTGPNAFNYRAPSPGIQPAPTLNTPYTENPEQGYYHLPPMHGNPPNPAYAAHPLAGSAGFCESVEGDLGVPSVQGHTNLHQHLVNQQSLGPLMPSAMVAGRNFEREGPFLFQHGRDPNLLLQHGGPFVDQSIPYIQDSFMCLDRQSSAMEKGGPEDKDVFVRWLSSFLSCRRKEPPAKTDAVQAHSIAEARGLIYSAFRLVSQLDSLCQIMESHDKEGELWTRDYEKAADIRVDLEKKLKELEKPGYIQGVKRKLDVVHKKRLRWQRRRQATEEEKEALERSAEKEASIDLWRMQCIQKVEEKKRERELKATADGVLGEVRKKQNDVKKMLDVLKSLEKLRKLRKEAAGRKGVSPPPSADETFTNHINRLRTMVHKRSALYDAEEKTLRVILEGEQEEERQRAKDRRLRKERERTLQKQRELDGILFGDTESLPSLHPLQPFRQYYLQAEHSVVSLVQIRHEWDQFLVPPDHPDGSSVPPGWLVPTAPCNDTWATALKQSD
ncbi:programmed cell death protein 7 [Phyllobates terribilis]|uniref:programmed cell death protein 7 n=1 Tax=Phyllobates terribilis TaxID=111132 RepID=UPI003CCADA78